jgi:hypothetical protein
MSRHFGGKHNAVKAEFLIALSLLESALEPLTPDIISSFCVGVSTGYIRARGQALSKWGYVSREPIVANGRLTYAYAITPHGRNWIITMPGDISRDISSKLAVKINNRGCSLMQGSDIKSKVTKHNRNVIRTRAPIFEEPVIEAQVTSKHAVEYLHYRAGFKLYVVPLDKDDFVILEADFIPQYCINTQSYEHARGTFRRIKSGELQLFFQNGEIIEG